MGIIQTFTDYVGRTMRQAQEIKSVFYNQRNAPKDFEDVVQEFKSTMGSQSPVSCDRILFDRILNGDDAHPTADGMPGLVSASEYAQYLPKDMRLKLESLLKDRASSRTH
jgi:hypothetical protein